MSFAAPWHGMIVESITQGLQKLKTFAKGIVHAKDPCSGDPSAGMNFQACAGRDVPALVVNSACPPLASSRVSLRTNERSAGSRAAAVSGFFRKQELRIS